MAVKRKVLTNLRIDEVSSVDRGAGEGVKILLMKRDTKRKAMGSIGEMFSKLFSSGGNNNSVIIDKSVEGLAESIGTIVVESSTPEELSANLAKSFEQFGEHLKTSLTTEPAVIEKKENNMDLKALAKAFGLPETATEAEVQVAVTKSVAATAALSASVKKMNRELQISKAGFTDAEMEFWKASYDAEENDEEGDGDPKGKGKPAKKFLEAGHVERASIMKAAAPPVDPAIAALMESNAALTKRLNELEAGGSLVSFGKRATELGLPEAEAVTLQKAYSGDPVAIEKLETHMKSLIATAKAGGVFKEFGTKSGTGVDGTPYDQLMELAKKALEKEPALGTIAKAFAKVYEDPAHAELAAKERGQNRPQAA